MPDLLLIDVALVALLIILAGWVVIGRRRRQRNRVSMGAGERPGTATELGGEGTAGRETTVVPGFGEDPAEPDLDASAAAEPEQAAEPQASRTTSPAPDPDGARAGRDGARAGRDGPRAGRDGPRAGQDGPRAGRDGPRAGQDGPRAGRDGQRAKADMPDRPGAEPDRPGAEPDMPRAGPDGPEAPPDGPDAEPARPRSESNGQPSAVSDRIGSYYDEADRAMSDYLAAMGWTEEPETRGSG